MSVADLKVKFREKRLDVMPNFTNKVFNGFNANDTPIDPTDDQMTAYADQQKITIEEAWHRFRGEYTIGQFALQVMAFGFTPDMFKNEFTEIVIPANSTPEEAEEIKLGKAHTMSRFIRKCVSAVFGVDTYSYFREDLEDFTYSLSASIPSTFSMQNPTQIGIDPSCW